MSTASNLSFRNESMSSSVTGVINAFLKDWSNFSCSRLLFLGDNVKTSLSMIGQKTNLKKSLRSSSFSSMKSLAKAIPSIFRETT